MAYVLYCYVWIGIFFKIVSLVCTSHISLFQMYGWYLSRILTWGDGYVDKVTKDTQIRDLHDDLADSDNQIISPIWSNNDQYQSYPLCPIEAALLSMCSHSYSLGEE